MELFTLMGKLGLDATEFMDGVKESVEEAGGLQKALSKVGSVVVKGVSNLTSYGDAVDKGSKKLGISAKAYQELGHAMEASGTNIDSLGTGMKNLNAYLQGTAGKKASDAFAKLGFTPQQLASMSSADEQLSSILSKLADMSDKSARSDIVETLFGKNAGAAMSALLDEGSEGIEKLKQEAEDLGLVMSDEDIEAAVKAGDAMANLEAALTSMLNEGLTPLLPAISSIVDSLTPAIQALAPLIKDAADALTKIITSVLQFFGIGTEGEGGEGQKPASEQNLEQNLFGGFNGEQTQKLQDWINAQNEATTLENQMQDAWMNGQEGTPEYNALEAQLEAAQAKAAALNTELTGVTDATGKNILSSYMTWAGEQGYGEGGTLPSIISEAGSALQGAGEAAEALSESLNTQSESADTAKEALAGQAESADTATESLDAQADAADTAKDALDSQADSADSSAASLDDQATSASGAATSADSAASALSSVATASNRAASALNSVHAPAVDGSHAGGLDYVPYDGYRAELHKGERVLTASENASYSRGGSVSGNLASAIAAAVREGMRGATVEAVLDGQKITDNVSKRMARDLRTMRYAT